MQMLCSSLHLLRLHLTTKKIKILTLGEGKDGRPQKTGVAESAEG